MIILLSAFSLLSGIQTANGEAIDVFSKPLSIATHETYEKTLLSIDRTESLIATTQYNAKLKSKLKLGVLLKLNFMDEELVFTVSEVDKTKQGDVTYSAEMLVDKKQSAGKDDTPRVLSIAESGGSIVGSLTYNGALYKLRPNGKGETLVIEVNETELLDHDDAYFEDFLSSHYSDFDIETHAEDEVLVGQLADSGNEYTVIVAYTSAFAQAAGNIPAYMNLLQQETNTAYANSGVSTRVNIVHSYQTRYNDTGNFSRDISNFSNTRRATTRRLYRLRNRHQADLMILLTGNGYSFCGQASGIGVNARNAFAVARESCATGYYSFGHEIGHLFGARHIITQDNSRSPYAYGHGYCNVTPNTWRTTMAYNCPANTGGPRIQQWSNPNVSISGQTTGSTALENNARVLNVRATTVANFRDASAQTQ